MYTPQFNPQPLGAVTVTTPGTPVRLTVNLTTVDPTTNQKVTTNVTDPVVCNKISLAANPLTHGGAGNTGKVYIGSASMNRSTLLGVIAIIAAGGSYTIVHNVGNDIYDVSKMYVDADTGGDGVYGAIDTV